MPLVVRCLSIAAGGWVLLAALGAILARSLAQDVATAPDQRLAGWLVGGGTLLSLAFWAIVLARGNRLAERIGTPAVAAIALLGALHFAVAFGSKLLGAALGAVAGPYALFLQGIGDEGLPCLLLAITIVLWPRAGVMLLALVTVYVLQVVFNGSLGVSSLIFVSVSVVLHEALLAAFGVTVGSRATQPSASVPPEMVLRVAVAIGLANAAAYYAQFAMFRVLSRMVFNEAFVRQVVGVTGLYGTLGAAVGAVLGLRLRRTAP